MNAIYNFGLQNYPLTKLEHNLAQNIKLQISSRVENQFHSFILSKTLMFNESRNDFYFKIHLSPLVVAVYGNLFPSVLPLTIYLLVISCISPPVVKPFFDYTIYPFLTNI